MMNYAKNNVKVKAAVKPWNIRKKRGNPYNYAHENHDKQKFGESEDFPDPTGFQ